MINSSSEIIKNIYNEALHNFARSLLRQDIIDKNAVKRLHTQLMINKCEPDDGLSQLINNHISETFISDVDEVIKNICNELKIEKINNSFQIEKIEALAHLIEARNKY